MSTFCAQRWAFSERLRQVNPGSPEWFAILAEYRRHMATCPTCLAKVVEMINRSKEHPELEEPLHD
jgi:hypothetical protein